MGQTHQRIKRWPRHCRRCEFSGDRRYDNIIVSKSFVGPTPQTVALYHDTMRRLAERDRRHWLLEAAFGRVPMGIGGR